MLVSGVMFILVCVPPSRCAYRETKHKKLILLVFYPHPPLCAIKKNAAFDLRKRLRNIAVGLHFYFRYTLFQTKANLDLFSTSSDW